MVKIFNNGNWKKKSGLTLVETVISLSVIVIVSVATVSIAVFSANSFKRSDTMQYFVHEIDSMIKLYLSYDETDFIRAINSSYHININGYEDTNFCMNNKYEFLTSDSNYSYNLVFDFDSDISLTISSFYENGNLIYERSANK